VPRDTLFGERIIWTGYPRVIVTPPFLRAAAAVLFVTSAVSTSYALVLSLALQASPAASLLFAAWCASLGLACLHVPRIWLSKVRYVVTENHVISQRGPFRRSIERRAITFARIFWDKQVGATGDVDLVRAVPTGALRRRLMLRLNGVAAPDRVWAIVRGEQDVAPRGNGARPLAQRLDTDERVLWSAQPRPTLRAWLPQGPRAWALVFISLFLFAVLIRMVVRAVSAFDRLLQAGLPASSFPFIALVFGLGATVLIVLAIAVYGVYDVIVRPGRLVQHTRYLITNKRVLIQRGREELHLDRSRIVDVIDAPAGHGLSDVFLVLDGPRARALAASGAFGELDRGPSLRPVFQSVVDGESVTRILRDQPKPKLPQAA
jgi:hypothetical protein